MLLKMMEEGDEKEKNRTLQISNDSFLFFLSHELYLCSCFLLKVIVFFVMEKMMKEEHCKEHKEHKKTETLPRAS